MVRPNSARRRAHRRSRFSLALAAATPLIIGLALAQDAAPILPPAGMVGQSGKAAPTTPKKPAATPQKKAPAPDAAGAPVTLTPRAWARSSYSFEGRLESTVQDVKFEVPPAYQENFAFWGNRMKGTERIELIQYITMTKEPQENGNVPFHRQVARFMVDLSDRGQVKTTGPVLNRAVQGLAWDGTLDPRGLVIEMKRVSAPEDTSEVDRLSFPLLDQVLPVLDAATPLKPGETLTFTSTLPLPSKMTVNGLEDIAARMTRVLTLKEVHGSQATFSVATSYVLDPATPPKAPRTTCVIGGGGDGEATFDLDGGFFINARLQTRMTIDIEAPLRPLPGQPEGTDPGVGKSHLVLLLTLFGKQTAAQMFSAEPASSN